jgi:NADH-quinone oxidoreductase subunit L
MSMTFFGAYRGTAWEAEPVGPADRLRDIRVAARHGAPHPADPYAHGHAHEDDHEVAHGPADPGAPAGHGHGPWHGPHESPAPMTYPLLVLAVGAMVAGFVGVPTALWGSNAIERFLEPSFTARQEVAHDATAEVRPKPDATADDEEAHASRGLELSLMAFSVLIAVGGIALAYKVYVVSPEISERLATRWAGIHRTLLNKYYVDEMYDATVVSGTFAGARGLWTFDRRVVDGVVNGSGWVTLVSSWLSGLTDRTVVDGLVNFVGRICEEGSFWFRRLQTGLVQNYALLMLFGIFAFVSIYLLW